MDGLGKLMKSYRKVDNRVTNNNKNSIINLMNKYAKAYGFEKLRKDATVREVQRAKTIYKERLAYDVLDLATQEGNTVITGIVAKDLRKSDETDYQRLGKYAPKLAAAKKESLKKLSEHDAKFIEDQNQNVPGYGNMKPINLLESARTDAQAEKIIAQVKLVDPKELLYGKHFETLNRTFQKIEGVRFDALEKVKSALKEMSMEKLVEHTNSLMQTLSLFYDETYKKNNETELANARLDDVMIRMGLKKDGKRKVSATFKKYKLK